MSIRVGLDDRGATAGDARWEQAGVSYRQLQLWTDLGLLRTVDKEVNPGSGYWRRWPEGEIAVAGQIARLCTTGMRLRLCERVARASGPVEIGPGVWVGLADLEEAAP